MPAPTAAGNLAALQALYAETLTALRLALATAGPNVTVDGVSVDRMGYIRGLREQLTELAKVPGVALGEVFTLTSVVR